jgi:hypothetical protein
MVQHTNDNMLAILKRSTAVRSITAQQITATDA